MIEFTNLSALSVPDGVVHQIFYDEELLFRRPNENLNRVPYSIDTDGGIYNGCGSITDKRMDAQGNLIWQSTTITTGFIPYKKNDVIRLYQADWIQDYYIDNGESTLKHSYLSFFDKDFKQLGFVNINSAFTVASSGVCGSDGSLHIISVDTISGITTFRIHFTDGSNVKYFRMSVTGSPENTFVTLSEPIIDKKLFTNQIVYAIDTDGGLYNGKGYKTGHRVRSGGAEINVDKAVCTGFISVKNGDVVRISGCNFKEVSAQNAINICDKNFANLGQIALNSG